MPSIRPLPTLRAIARVGDPDRALLNAIRASHPEAETACAIADELAAKSGISLLQFHERLGRLEQAGFASVSVCECPAHPRMHLRLAFPAPGAADTSTAVPIRPRVEPGEPQQGERTTHTLEVMKERAQGRPWVCFVSKTLIPGVSKAAMKDRLKALRTRGCIRAERCNCSAFLGLHTRATFLPAAGHVVTHAGTNDVRRPPPAPPQRQTARRFALGLLQQHADRELTAADINNELPAPLRYDRSTLAEALRNLRAAGLLEEFRGPGDRVPFWRVTAAGLDHVP